MLCEEIDDVRERLGILQHEQVTALVRAHLRTGDPLVDRPAVGRRGDAVELAAGHERRRGDPGEAVGDVVAAGGPRAASPRRAAARACARGRRLRHGWRRSPGRADGWRGTRRRSGCRRASARWRCVRRRAARPARAAGTTRRPLPPAEVHTSASRSMRAGAVTAISWATIPPKLTPTRRVVAQPTWSSRASASAAKSAIVGWLAGTLVRPSPRWSWTSTWKWRRSARSAVGRPRSTSRSR